MNLYPQLNPHFKNMAKENHSELTDHELGMDRAIPRRDFLNGAAMTIGVSLLPGALHAGDLKADEPQDRTGYNPPVTNGLRGSHPG